MNIFISVSKMLLSPYLYNIFVRKFNLRIKYLVIKWSEEHEVLCDEMQ
jgi:hypothetical protein